MADPKPVKFKEAIDFFTGKVNLPTNSWTDLWKEQHTRAFVIAGATKEALLTDFKKAVTKALDQGTTLAEFRSDFDRIVAAHGWEYNGGAGWRSRVIYQTNLRMARAAGRWAQIEKTKKRRPYIRYTAIKDDRTRPEHKAWDNTVLPVDDAFWETHAPPNGWNCRCKLQIISERDLKRYGLEVSNKAPAIKIEDRQVNTPVGKVSRPTPEGIDTGFDYNVGQAAWGRKASPEEWKAFKAIPGKEWEPLNEGMTKGGYQDYGRSEKVPADIPKARAGRDTKNRAEMADAVRRAIGANKEITIQLKDSTSLLIDVEELANHVDLSRGPFMPYLREVLEDPFEIWISFEKHKLSGKIVLRKRLVKVLDIPKQGKILVVANASRSRFMGWSFIPVRNDRRLNMERYGKLLYGRE